MDFEFQFIDNIARTADCGRARSKFSAANHRAPGRPQRLISGKRDAARAVQTNDIDDSEGGQAMQTTKRPISPDVAQTLIAAAVLAPSSHNTPTIVCAIGEHSINIISRPAPCVTGQRPSRSRADHQLWLRLVQSARRGSSRRLSARVTPCPDADEEACWPAFALRPRTRYRRMRSCTRQSPRRRTVRQRFAAGPLETAAIQALIDAAAGEGATLHVLATHTQRHDAAALVAEGDAVQWANISSAA